MIRAVVLDIDGVVVGTRAGVNFPNPSDRVSTELRKVHDSGIPVVFITGKSSFGASGNIIKVGIDNPHITDGGAVLINPVKSEVIHVKTLRPDDITNIMLDLSPTTFINAFTLHTYYVSSAMRESHGGFITRYTNVVTKPPTYVDDFKDIIDAEPITKLNIVAFDEDERLQITERVANILGNFTYKWSSHPNLPGAQIMLITAQNVSKASGLKDLSQLLNIDPADMLGVGDTLHDWDFIELCGFRGVMSNGSDELKKKFDFTSHEQYMGGTVDEDGLLDILKHFNLI